MTENKSTKKPVILITNDDSYSAAGIRKLISLMRPLGKVVVVASEQIMSGMGHAITIKTPLRMKKIASEPDYEEYVCNGTPADCVKLGTQIVLKFKPDIVVSGINHGSNASINVIYSGTMAAVLEACIDGIPAIGFSLLEYSMDADFSHVDEYVTAITNQAIARGLPQGVCLNVNLPAISDEKPKGIKVCRQAPARWVEEFDSRMHPRGGDYHWLTGRFENDDLAEDTDQFALENNYVSVVPVQYDLTAYQAINTIKDWNL
ncbi:MAG: 5'/3'-nucleotidase SurE [Bacteroidales bacterium]|jgi:5'-nucleotidase|nr:5'/3'-nucleotidase SurE [Bacteroidales bacterium]MDN5350839.1 5/3-nucleotidase [Bacteroidales bacterium]